MANHTDWLNISTMSGSSGQTILTLTANTNLQSEDKVAIVKAYNPVYNVSATTTVRISAYTPYITVSPDMVGIPASGGTYQFSIQANCSYTIAYPEMVTDYSASGGTGNTNITFTVPSTSESATVVGNIVLTDITSQYSTTLRLEQYGQGAVIQINPTAVTIPFSGGTGNFTVSANCIYSISKGSGTWYSVSPESGYTGSTVFTVSAGTVNTGTTDWNDTISVVGPDGVAGTVATTQQNPGSRVINYTADTSTVAASGEVRTITIDCTDFINSSITVNIVGATGATYTYNQQSTTRGIITVTFSENTGAPRDYTVVVTGRRAMTTYTATASISYTQTEYVTVPIAYTADTSTVDSSGETRTITIDASNLVASSITIGMAGATGVTYSYNNGVITVTFPDNIGAARDITLSIDAKTTNGDKAEADITFSQEAGNPLGKYLTFKIISGGTILWKTSNSAFTRTIEYKKNNGNWTSITSNTGASAPSISVSAGDVVQFKGDNATYAAYNLRYNSFSGSTAKFEVEGNIMSLIDSTNFATATTLASSYTFYYLFYNCTGLTSAENLVLPATTLSSNCYNGMFYNCTNLTTAPAILPATTLASYCYRYMFVDCASLTTAPELPATTLAAGSYQYMFQGCTSLTSAPELPATTLAEACYLSMFQGCTSLTTAPELPATTLAITCYKRMFQGCTSLTTPPELPATILVVNCYSDMFYGCTSLTTAPELPVTTLEDYCYYNMFNGCTSLTTAPELPATTLAEGCYENMFAGCSSLNYIKCLATDISADYSTDYWVGGVASAGTFVKAGSMNDWQIDSVNGIPIGWTVQDDWGGLDEYLTFNIISGGTINWQARDASVTKTISYSKNNGATWTSITSTTAGTSFNVEAGDEIQFKGTNSTYCGSASSLYNNFSGSTAEFNVYGNIMSLIYGDNYAGQSALTGEYTFRCLFQSTNVIDASNLILPATALTKACYSGMFSPCPKLIAAPSLPAKTMVENCYINMFMGCSALIQIPELPATTLADYCYQAMFYGTSITSAPELPVTTLAEGCYKHMFQNCTGLTSAPELPATTLVDSCYYNMFNGCTSLNYIKCLATNISATSSTTQWVQNVASSGTFVGYEVAGWTIGDNGIPYNWILSDRQIPYTADTSTVAASGEVRTITIDTTDLVLSSITIDITGATYTYENGVITVTFPENEGGRKNVAVNVKAETNNGEIAKAKIAFIQEGGDLPSTPLTFNIISGGTIYWKSSVVLATVRTVEYKKNDGEWTTITSNTGASAPSISVSAGDVVEFRGNNDAYSEGFGARYCFFDSLGAMFEAEGNIMSLIDSENFAAATALTKNYTFTKLFRNCTGLTSASNFLLPATRTREGCYWGMFSGCTSLTSAPELPATNGEWTCYADMFNGCSSLITAPSILPATALGNCCYVNMFSGCTSLTTAPELPATALNRACYANMFQGCTSLISAPELPATALTLSCYTYMFADCTSLTTAPELPATTLADWCYKDMFAGCTSLTTVPSILPATALTNYCYSDMFSGCTSLTTAPALPATTLDGGCYYAMFKGCTSLTTAPVLPATTLTSSCYSNMFNGCTSLNYIKCLATDISASNCTNYWVSSVSSTGTFVTPSSTNWSTGVKGIPSGWTRVNA